MWCVVFIMHCDLLFALLDLACVDIVSFDFEFVSRGFLSCSCCCCANLLVVIFTFWFGLGLVVLLRVA